MRKLSRLLSFTNILSKNRKLCCCASTRCKPERKLVFPNAETPASLPTKRTLSVLTSPQNSLDNGIKKLMEEFPSPKVILWRIINEAFCMHQKEEIKPIVTAQQIPCGDVEKIWQVTLTMNWPERFDVGGIAGKKAEAENIAYLYACQKMKTYGILDENNNVALPKNVITFGNITIKAAKGELGNIYQNIWTRYGRKDYIPKFSSTQVSGVFGKESCWKSVLLLAYPEQKAFEAYSIRLREAESIAATKALHWLYEQGIINVKRRLIEYTKEEEQRMLKFQSAPYSICISEALQEKMAYVLHNIEETKRDDLENSTKHEDILKDQDTEHEIYDIITDRLHQQLSEEEITKRCCEMFEKNVSFKKNNSESELKEIQLTKALLPIYVKREHILKLLDENQVVVLSGETGCGKTTQVPQFILEHYVNNMKGALCNIVVTQPRRISAITIAERVATERGEKLGETIGYQVRLNKHLPKKKGAILYCSTGMLLRKLYFNPNVAGVSHIIIDEVHERNIQIDFLLILLKKILEQNKDIKVLLMSASFNTHTFSQYFNNCPVIHIPGKIHPVKEYFLEDLEEKGILNINNRQHEPTLDVDLVVTVINHIDAFEKPGAILCFLPGWHEIQAVSSKLQFSNGSSSKLMICPAHSRLPHEQQKNIFRKPSEGYRKVILATNIAETSITVDDVVYVLNSGLHKGTAFDTENGIASLCTRWITKANVRQRRGRAGRVQPGVCYHLFSRKIVRDMDDYPLPELLRMPLESVILDCKLYCSDTKAEDFLSLALQPPSRSAVHLGIRELQISGILDNDENLTDLGKVVVNFATHPRLSIALIYGAFLGCLDPVLTICALIVLGKEPFKNTLENKSFIKEVKKSHDNFLYSDHLSLSKMYDTWKTLSEKSDAAEYVAKNQLDEHSLSFVQQLKGLFAEDLYHTNIIDKQSAFSDPHHKCNTNSAHVPSIIAALTAAFYPNIMKVTQGEIHHGRLNKDAIIYSLLKGQRGYIQKESVASNEYELPSPWFIYFSALQSAARRLMMTSSVSSVSGICLLLFAGQELTIRSCMSNEAKEGSAILLIDKLQKLNFSCSEREANLLIKWRNELNEAFITYVKNLKKIDGKQNALSVFSSDFLPILKELLEIPQIPFVKGQFYKFHKNDLVTEEW